MSGSDYYAVGYQENAMGNDVATLWKNGIATNLTDGTDDALATSIVVIGNDVYVGGRADNQPTGGYRIAKIWKNGIATNLTNGSRNAEVRSLFISGTDVYALGEEDNNLGTGVPKVWKNGVATNVDLTGVSQSYVRSIFVNGNDVYVVGNVRISTDPNSNRRAAIWKNNQLTFLSDGTSNADAFSVKAKGSDVYVSGHIGDKATTWKNNISSSVTTSSFSSARSIFLLNDDVYTAGQVGNIATIWKNGLVTNITNGTNQAEIQSLFVINQ